MKIKLTIILFFILNSIAFGQGVEFEFMTLSRALERSKEENKIIFLHNGEHCGWGAKSIKSLESSIEAGKFFNDNFINIRPKNEYEIDAVFSISDSPRYFFITPEGEINMMVSLYHKPEKLIKLGAKVLEGKVIKPNISMYTGKMYPKNKETLKMLSCTMRAHLALNISDTINYSEIDKNLLDKIINPDLTALKLELHNSYDYGKYYYNQFLMVLVNEINGEKQKSKDLAEEIFSQYPIKDHKMARKLTDEVLLRAIENH